jgi:hypothetical protein
MKTILTILLFISTAVSGQPYVANWSGSGHTLYKVQQSIDTAFWITVATVAGTTSEAGYQCNIPGATYYYRVIADKDSTPALLVDEALSIQQNNGHGHTKTAITQLSIKVTVDADIHYTILSPKTQPMDYQLYDIAGREISNRKLFLYKGQNDIFDRRPPASGVYIAGFSNYFNKITIKIHNL